MIIHRRLPLKLLSLWAVFLYLEFIAAASLPGIVICHRAEGVAAVEIAGQGVSCSCQECEHCLERLAQTWSGHRPDRAVLEACHCSHEPILDASERSVLRRDDRVRMILYASAGENPGSPGSNSIAMPNSTERAFFSAISPPFSGRISFLRC